MVPIVNDSLKWAYWTKEILHGHIIVYNYIGKNVLKNVLINLPMSYC